MLKRADMHVHCNSEEVIYDGSMLRGKSFERVVNGFVQKTRKKIGRKVKLTDYRLYYRINLNAKRLYNLAKRRGMDYFTITDHNEIQAALDFLKKYPSLEKETIIGEEVTTKFKDRNFCIHLGVYDINQEIHDKIQELRHDVERLVPFLKKNKILYVLNHPFAIPWIKKGERITVSDIDRFDELFPTIETRNGIAPKKANKMAASMAKHRKKGVIGGSDCHSYMIAGTWTESFGETKEEFLESIRKGRARVKGRHASIPGYVGDIFSRTKRYGHKLYIEGYGRKAVVHVDENWEKYERKLLRWMRITSPLFATAIYIYGRTRVYDESGRKKVKI